MASSEVRTITDELARKLVVLLHKSQIQCRTVAHFIVGIVQASSQQYVHAALNLRILLSNTELGQCGDGGCAHNRILEHNTIVDVANVLCGLRSPGTLHTQQVEHTNGELRELAVLNELT